MSWYYLLDKHECTGSDRIKSRLFHIPYKGKLAILLSIQLDLDSHNRSVKRKVFQADRNLAALHNQLEERGETRTDRLENTLVSRIAQLHLEVQRLAA